MLWLMGAALPSRAGCTDDIRQVRSDEFTEEVFGYGEDLKRL